LCRAIKSRNGLFWVIASSTRYTSKTIDDDKRTSQDLCGCLRQPTGVKHYVHKIEPIRYWQGLDVLARPNQCRCLSPSFLLHPLDFIRPEEAKCLAFFPGMDLGIDVKLAVLDNTIAELKRYHDIVAMDQHAAAILESGGLRDIPTTPLHAKPAQSLS